MTGIPHIKATIAPVRERIIQHPLYPEMQRMDDIRAFTQYHVFAVWDFMSLLKSLQRNLTCTDIPWIPKGSAATRYLINEIVTGEESDVDPDGNRVSHFELYLQAMEQVGADTSGIKECLQQLERGKSLTAVINGLPPAVRGFVKHTFDLIRKRTSACYRQLFSLLAVKTLIPDMFLALVNDLDKQFPDKSVCLNITSKDILK